MSVVVAMYDIASDRRRARVADILVESGPRVQLSVFELDLAHREELTVLCARLTDVLDPDEDQVRLYSLPGRRSDRIVLGNRVLGERMPYLVV